MTLLTTNDLANWPMFGHDPLKAICELSHAGMGDAGDAKIEGWGGRVNKHDVTQTEENCNELQYKNL